MIAFEVRFREVEMPTGVRSWKARLKAFDANAVIKHLASQGLRLDCGGDRRHPDNVIAEEWVDDELHGRILLGGDRLIGTFVVEQIDVPNVGDSAAAAPTSRPSHTATSPEVVYHGYGAGYPEQHPSGDVPF